MNEQTALKQLQIPALLELAFDYAIFDRQSKDHFCDFSEIEEAQHNKEQWLAELASALQNPESYETAPAFAYLMPKNYLCDRRLVYLPLRDLIVRYAFCLVLAEDLEVQLIDTCFANRRASGTDAEVRFTEDFATGGWANFCQWQQEKADQYEIVIKTDISSFYDSICQEYLIDALAYHLKWSKDGPLLRLFARLMRTRVISTAKEGETCPGVSELRHGVVIGSSIEGYLTNIYLKSVDEAMKRLGVCYGRYVDDICIFADSEMVARKYLHELQAQLLPLGLNLNTAKTRLINKGDTPQAFAAILDQPLQLQPRFFDDEEDFDLVEDGKEYCKFISARNAEGQPLLPLAKRTEWHVLQLVKLLYGRRTAVKHATWLLVQTAIYRQVPLDIRRYARDFIIGLLADENTSDYVKCRCLHHLVKPRKKKSGGYWRFMDAFNATQNQAVMDLLPKLLTAQGTELKLMAVYLAYSEKWGIQAIEALVKQQGEDTCQPVQKVLARLRRIEKRRTAIFLDWQNQYLKI